MEDYGDEIYEAFNTSEPQVSASNHVVRVWSLSLSLAYFVCERSLFSMVQELKKKETTDRQCLHTHPVHPRRQNLAATTNRTLIGTGIGAER